MAGLLSRILGKTDIARQEKAVMAETDPETALEKAKDLRAVIGHQPQAVNALLRLIDGNRFPQHGAIDIVSEIVEAWPDDTSLYEKIAPGFDVLCDIDDLNSAPPDAPALHRIVDHLATAANDNTGKSGELRTLKGLATAARMLGRRYDHIAEQSCQRIIELEPDNSANHYNLGLFYKTRGRFAEGLDCNQTAARLAGTDDDGTTWNTGICATGAGKAGIALKIWKGIGQKIEMGRFGLPDGSYPQTKVKLAERPLAERTAEDDDPGMEETIWVERLSPCHGIVRSVLYQDLGVDYGDVVLFDGAPITYHTYGEEQIPVFPHLATLVRREYQVYRFAGTQGQARQLADASMDLPGDALIYSHTESYRELCSNCWRDPDVDHETHETIEHHVVTGRIAAPPDMDAADLLDRIDRAVEERDPCQLYSPDLCTAAGLEDRADMEQRRFGMLTGM